LVTDMQKIKFALCAGVTSILFLSACQPTIDKQVVQKRLNFKDAVQIEAEEYLVNPESVQWENTSIIQEDTDFPKKIVISINAPVPQYPREIPVLLIEPASFTENDILKLTGYFTDKQLYDGRIYTKEDVDMEKLILDKNLRAHNIKKPKGAEMLDEYFQERYDMAFDKNEEVECVFEKRNEGEYFSAKAYLYPNCIMSLGISNYGQINTSMRMHVRDYETASLDDMKYIKNGDTVQAQGLAVTYEEALSMANDAMQHLTDGDMILVRSALFDRVNQHGDQWGKYESPIGQSYIFYYAKSYFGIPSLFFDDAPEITEEGGYVREPYDREGAFVVVDDRGVTQFRYSSPSKITEIVNQNVAVLPFDELFEKLKDNIFYQYCWSYVSADIHVNITEVEFGMVREPVPDNKNLYYMAPAWNFIGNIHICASTMLNLELSGTEKSILALSAVDGSIVTGFESFNNPS